MVSCPQMGGKHSFSPWSSMIRIPQDSFFDSPLLHAKVTPPIPSPDQLLREVCGLAGVKDWRTGENPCSFCGCQNWSIEWRCRKDHFYLQWHFSWFTIIMIHFFWFLTPPILGDGYTCRWLPAWRSRKPNSTQRCQRGSTWRQQRGVTKSKETTWENSFPYSWFIMNTLNVYLPMYI